MYQTHFFSRILFKHFICSFKQLINNLFSFVFIVLIINALKFQNLCDQTGWEPIIVCNKRFFKIFETLI
jgi:hypothetical protein